MDVDGDADATWRRATFDPGTASSIVRLSMAPSR
jgi:hypothetical protein